jgi:hypothetical protein
VKKADVSFENEQAVVTYDPKAATVAGIIKVIENTPHMMGAEKKYKATVVKK